MHDHGHAHGRASASADARKLALALALILGFMAVEVVAGIVAGSLALLSDAAHMLTDAAAIGLSLVAAKLAARPARGAMTYGLGRAEILSAQANGVTLLVLAAFVAYEGVRRLVSPPDVDASLVLVVAVAGIGVNLVAAWVLARAERRSLNVEGSLQHVVTDLYAFIGTAVAAVVILATGFDRADPLVSLLIAALMVRSGYGLVRASGRVFLEAAPEGVDPDAIGNALARHPGVVEVHDLHVWEVTSGFPALSAHVLVGRDTDCHATRESLERVLHDHFAIDHTTLQVEHEGAKLLQVEGLHPERTG
ncbi:MAG TPA: cation diffusion facilitator family transporter [Thermoleophilaceae bacterium]|nr:cation diffusion facilitator family transporter [Thermoleophilaceae bacterium]